MTIVGLSFALGLVAGFALTLLLVFTTRDEFEHDVWCYIAGIATGAFLVFEIIQLCK